MSDLLTMALVALSIAFTSSMAHAQVNRCIDANGKVLYSDRICDAGQRGGQIERRKTRDEIYRERLQALDAEDRKQQQNLIEQQREAAQYNARAYQQAPVLRHSGNDWAARKALENSATSARSITNNGGKWDSNAEAERARARHEENLKRMAEENQRAQLEAATRIRPTAITNCFGYQCRDNMGGSYNRATGDKNLMIGPEGQRCTWFEPSRQWQCR